MFNQQAPGAYHRQEYIINDLLQILLNDALELGCDHLGHSHAHCTVLDLSFIYSGLLSKGAL